MFITVHLHGAFEWSSSRAWILVTMVPASQHPWPAQHTITYLWLLLSWPHRDSPMSCHSCLEWRNFPYHLVYHPRCWSERLTKEKVPRSGIPSNSIPEGVLDSCLHWWLCWEWSLEWRARVCIQYLGGREDKVSLATGLYSTNCKVEAEAENSSSPHWSQHSSFQQCCPPCGCLVRPVGPSVKQGHWPQWPGFSPTATCLAMMLLTLWQRRAQQKNKWIGLPATLRWRPSSRPSNTVSGGLSTHSTKRLAPTTC